MSAAVIITYLCAAIGLAALIVRERSAARLAPAHADALEYLAVGCAGGCVAALIWGLQ
jgi:hypothetical protein